MNKATTQPSPDKSVTHRVDESTYRLTARRLGYLNQRPVHDLKDEALQNTLREVSTNYHLVVTSPSWRTLNALHRFTFIRATGHALLKIVLAVRKNSMGVRAIHPRWVWWRVRTGLPVAVGATYKQTRFKEHAVPKVSIIIPVYNKAAMTISCLRSLVDLKTDYSFEVIVVDDHSTDVTKKIMRKIPGVRYFRNPKNLGFVGTCSNGAKQALGEIIIFLNNDTSVDKNWLDPLVERLSMPGVGVVGSKLIYPNRMLQEAGGIVFKDASAWNYGNGFSDLDYRFNFAREVDYCSGASLAIHKSLFDELGGLDERFSPAYYEDVDLCFSARKAGYKVIYEPRSALFHIEGGSAGTDTSSGMKRFQPINERKFRDKWKEELKQQPAKVKGYNTKLYRAARRGKKKFVLIVDHQVPSLTRDAGGVRMRRLITILQRMDYHVILWPHDQHILETEIAELQKDGVEVVYGEPLFDDYAKQYGSIWDVVILSRPSVAPNYMESCRLYSPGATILYDTVDLAYLRLKRQAEIEKDNALANESDEVRSIETALVERADVTLAISDEEARAIKKLSPGSRVETVSLIHEVKQLDRLPFEKRKGLLFIGGFLHHPNADAMVWFCREVLPLIAKRIPDISLTIVGSHPGDDVKRLKSKHVTVLGYVENVDNVFNEARVFVSPLRFGAGVKGKVCQAIEYGLPVVSTTVGSEGMSLKNNVDCLIADDAKHFADKVCELYTNQDLWQNIQTNAEVTLDKYFSYDAAERGLRKAIDS